MYQAFFFNNEGQYHAAIMLETDEEVLTTVFRYKNVVPRIMVTDFNDHSVIEAEEGAIVHPELSPDVAESLEQGIGSYENTVPLKELVESYKVFRDRYVASSGSDKNSFAGMVSLETELFAVAASEGVVLPRLGWQCSAVIRSEVEARAEYEGL